jgi:uncharacterized GH25 family protein
MSKRDPEPAGSFRIAGRVVGPNGVTVAGADVSIDSIPRREAVSSADGTFVFEKLISRSYEIRAKAGELIGGPQMFRPTANSAPVVISLREGAHIFVTVVDAANAPVVNAEVRIVGEDAIAVTDEKGEAKVTTHPGWVALEATAENRAPRRVHMPLGSTARITIVLHEGFAVSGRVVDEERKPIANARIHAVQSSSMLATSEEEGEAAATDSTGAFTISSAVGMHSFVAIDDEHAPAATPVFDIDRAIAGLEIVMKRGAVYAGSVVDQDGKPVTAARVYCDSMGPLGPRRSSTTTDAKGMFEIRGLPRTVAMAYATSEKGTSDEAMVELTTEPERGDQRLVVSSAGDTSSVISGVVVDDAGAPVPDLQVNVALRRRMDSAMNQGGVDPSAATSTRTDSNGQFSIADLTPGEYGLWPGAFAPQPFPIEAAQYALASMDRSWFMTTAKTGEKNVRLVMSRTGSIKGRVVFADTGESVSELTVRLEPSHDHDFGTSGTRGVIDLHDLRTGTFALRVSGPDFLMTGKKDVRVEPGKTTDIGTLTVERGRIVRGRVVDGAGHPVPGARVMLGHIAVYGGLGRFDAPYYDHQGAVTDASGTFSISGVETKAVGTPGIVAGADHPSYGRSLPVAIPAGVEPPPITLTLLECGSIAGRVTKNGKPVSHVMIGAGWPEYGVAETNEDGEFVLSRLPAGPVVLRFHLSTELSGVHQRTVNVEAGKRTDVTVDIPTGTIKLAVTVKPKPGHEVAGAKLFLVLGTATFDTYAQLSARLFPVASWEGDPNRPATFERIVPGDYTVCTMPLAWSPSDDKQMKRVRRDRAAVKVYCTPVRVQPAPLEQMLAVEVPAMAPLP